MKKSFFKIASIAFLFLLLVACDKDFNSIDSDVIADGDFALEVREVQNINAFTQKTEAVQTNNLPLNALGVFNNPKFGVTILVFYEYPHCVPISGSCTCIPGIFPADVEGNVASGNRGSGNLYVVRLCRYNSH